MFYEVGLIGLGPMGRAFAQNTVDKGFGVKAWDIDADVRERAKDQLAPSMVLSSLDDLLSALAPPRLILLFVPSGQPVDDTLDILRGGLRAGDIVADCGNSHYRETLARSLGMAENKVDFIGVGVSGGPAGARSGPAIMAGGDRGAWDRSKEVFQSVAAKSDDTACCDYFGRGGAGHFVKMVHNGIEYGVMQLLAELFGYLEEGLGLEVDEIAAIFQSLNHDFSAGYLTEITSIVVAARASPEGRSLVHVVDDAAEQKGTGRWTVEAALDFGAAIPTIAEAVFARCLSSNRALRQEYSEPRIAPGSLRPPEIDQAEISAALALALASTFAQGLSLCLAAGEEFGEELDRAAILRTWRQGCILRGQMVTSLIQAVDENPQALNVLTSGVMREIVADGLPALRSLTAKAVATGIPMAGFCSALAYVELLQGAPWPGRVIQLQRDYFGSHGLKDKDTGEEFHGPWHEDNAP